MSDITPTSPALPSQPISQPTPAEHSIYVGDLPVGITEEELTKVFGQASPVVKISIGLPKKNTDQVQRAYAHVTYSSAEDANAAIREFNQTEFSGKPCRVTKSTKGTSKGLPEANIFVKDLPLKLSALAFHDTFSAFGEILSSKLAVDHENVSKGYGFVQYATAEQAQKAITETNGSTLDVEGADKPINTSLFVKKESRPPAREFTNLFFKNLPTNITQEKFTKTWSKYGVITSAFLTLGKDGKPTGTGFANFEKASAAAKVVKATKKKAPNGVHAVRALSKAEREHHQSTKAPSAPEVSA
ncbi:hypothetical protein MJO28_016089 [Puccinia striiformis f. sp. tritici]|uniref:RRM domain-containing protein n=4 Tax=Puccinia striiformis TaxID=27350 RepID=A0A0L0W210_9BASI|nr:hypothetical protein Pst134EA_028879 [Puccinia striiformis f. sp. tritici]KAI9623419.1 hypothetical protein H4Q26_014587 [Puccinia striiformis f. sp. tritici PST-130]KNF05497.1 hypothetical protein PSTG_01309 [Puccinia striiformis f. sp. tritici PST-78]POW12852.1 hypothetical protein PSTT_04134 [Puccinia striiformis]KAH9440940.1 hypothetical protein Pst134EB_029592 [Puccinia striiformis f. sp. tritici]KAH9446891.1 hypothetical protein Pst134EA_028879 [Puccinia striiformis f. sp. tritici]